jgi:hypothetical protein
MSRHRTLLMGASLLAGFATGVATLWLWSQEQALSADEASASIELATNRQLRSVASAQRRSSPSDFSLAAGQPAAPKPTTSAPRNRFDTVELELSVANRLPEYAPYNRARFQRQAMRLFGEWFNQLKVPAERVAVLKQTIADEMLAQQDEYQAMLDSGFTSDSDGHEERLRNLLESSEARLRQALTPDEYASYHRFDLARTWIRNLSEIDEYFGERGVAPLTPAQRRSLVDAAVQAEEWKKQHPELKPGIQYRRQAEQLATILAPSLDSERQKAFASYIEFFSQRTKLKGEIWKPEDPDSIAYTSNAEF